MADYYDRSAMAEAMKRAFQRSTIIYFPAAAAEQDLDAEPSALMRAVLRPFGFEAKPSLWIHELNLDRGYIVVLNGSKTKKVDLSGMHMCNEERRHRFIFPQGFALPPLGRVKVYCGVTAPLSPDMREGNEQTLYWEHERGDPVLNLGGDAAYLWDSRGGVCSAFAKCDDGKAKRYTPSRIETQHHAFYNLALLLNLLRLLALGAAVVVGTWPLLAGAMTGGIHQFTPPLPMFSLGQLDLEKMLLAWIAAFALDLAERLAAERSGPDRAALAHSVALLCDRVASAQLYGTLALCFAGPPALTFLALGALDFAATWLTARGADRHQPRILTVLTELAPHSLPLICVGSEAFLVLCLLSHPVLWATLSTGPTPPLAMAPLCSRLLACLCVLKHLLMALNLFHALGALGPGLGAASAAAGASAGASATGRKQGDRFGERPSAGSEMAEIADLVRERLPTLTQDGASLGPSHSPFSGAHKARAGKAHMTHAATITSDDEDGSGGSETEGGDRVGRMLEIPNLRRMRATRLSSFTSNSSKF